LGYNKEKIMAFGSTTPVNWDEILEEKVKKLEQEIEKLKMDFQTHKLEGNWASMDNE